MLDNTVISNKIAIVTIDSMNFGNKLQNYALQCSLNSIGFNVETFKSNRSKTIFKKVLWKISRSKGYKFFEFRRLINWSKVPLSNLCLINTIKEQYDYFIVGSDQVWNPNYNFIGSTHFLTFAKQYQRISYAASFGVSKIPIGKQDSYKKRLSEIPNISVREETGADIVESLIGIRPQVVLDPTLLLTSSQWHNIAKKPSFKLPEKYVLKYFLGHSDESVLTVQKYLSDQEGLVSFDIRALNKFKKELPVGPSEFLYLIENSECVITDSFHGSVFSLLFKKPFVVFDRKDEENDMSSRIDSLCKMFDLNDHRYRNEKFYIENVLNPDYSHVEDIILKEKEKSFCFLKKALNISCNNNI